ncbi:MAG TPA: xanthine dehydrogenase family protein molybdopterin-binding subunit [Stellaceae bacterium]|nr:xanthine dehydrogenase family protein molybdopterin-binding subunit [Stellaceae bacterium]
MKQGKNAFIGNAIDRVEDLRLLRGKGQFVDDLAREGLLHAAILRSSVAHGRIRSVDVSATRMLPGVHAVITAHDVGPAIPTIPLRQDAIATLQRLEQPVIAHDKVRYVGEPIAVVIADSAASAEDALETIELDIEMLPAVTSWDAALHGPVRLFETVDTNLACELRGAKGDADAAFRNADYKRRERFHVQRHTAVPMEPRGLLAEWDVERGTLTVWGAAKVPFAIRKLLSRHLGLPEAAVTVMESDIGSGFGVRGEYYPEDFLIPFAARAVGRPVRWIEDRREHLLATNHAREVDGELEIACRRDGTILGLRGRAYVDMGAYIRTNAVTPARNIAQVVSGPYRVPNVRMDVSMVMSNKTPVGTYRGPGRFEVDFFRERLFDMAARDLGIDRVDFRRRNLVAAAEMPYPLPTVMPLDSATECDSGDYATTLDRCLAEIDWPDKVKLQGRLIDGRYHGLGVGCYIEGGASGPRENVRLVVEPGGDISVYVGSSAVGQGLETALTQIAADALEIPIGRIRGVFHGSTTYVREGYGSYGSRSVVMGGSAIWAAAANLKAIIRRAAAERLKCPPEAIEILDGVARSADGGAIALGALAGDGLEAEGSFASDKRTYSYGAHAAHVAVDPRTGHVSVIEYVAVEDVGRIINPKMLHSQTVGAIVQGLGGALLEHLIYDDSGQLLTATFADYLLPTTSDVPNIRVVTLEERPSPNNPLGAKGAGEGGIIPVGGVIANAVAAALAPLKVEPRELPISPARLWALIAQTRQADRR